jgi:DNA-binding transcriptional MerR regulator
MIDHTPIYNLKAVIHETGLTPETLRAWERRYGLLKPQRSPGGHRLYSQYDIEMLQWLVARQAEGLSISRAVEMWRSLENEGHDPLQHGAHLLSSAHAASPIGSTAVVEAGGSMLEQLRAAWIAACMAFDESAADQALSQAFAIAAPEVACIELIQKGIAAIGEGWYQGEVSVQQEHFASALAMRRLDALIAAAPPPTRAGRLLAANPPGEEHSFGLLLMTYLLRRRGWEVVYLGANVPLARLDATLKATTPKLVLSVAQTLNSAAALRQMAEVVNAHGARLAYGGGIFNFYPAITGRIAGYSLGATLAEVPQAVEQLLTRFPPLPEIPPLPPEYALALEQFKDKESLIVNTVNQAFHAGPARPGRASIEPAYLETANRFFTRDLVSALSLGDIHLLDHAAGWLEGLLGNYGLSTDLAKHYFDAFLQAVQQHIGAQAQPALDWLESHAS